MEVVVEGDGEPVSLSQIPGSPRTCQGCCTERVDVPPEIPTTPDANLLNAVRFGSDTLRFVEGMQDRFGEIVAVPAMISKQGLVQTEGDRWRRQRTLMGPAFAGPGSRRTRTLSARGPRVFRTSGTARPANDGTSTGT